MSYPDTKKAYKSLYAQYHAHIVACGIFMYIDSKRSTVVKLFHIVQMKHLEKDSEYYYLLNLDHQLIEEGELFTSDKEEKGSLP